MLVYIYVYCLHFIPFSLTDPVASISQHLLGQTEDLLPSAVTLLMAFPETQKKGSHFATFVSFLICANSNW